jgi:hypothetical protein
MKIILLLFLIATKSVASSKDYGDAASKAAQALYTQTGTEAYFTSYAQNLDKKYLTDDLRKEGFVAAILLQCIIQERITWKWSW